MLYDCVLVYLGFTSPLYIGRSTDHMLPWPTNTSLRWQDGASLLGQPLEIAPFFCETWTTKTYILYNTFTANKSVQHFTASLAHPYLKIYIDFYFIFARSPK